MAKHHAGIHHVWGWLAGSALALLVLEGIVRLGGLDPYARWGGLARDDPKAPVIGASVTRIVIVGDSQTAGPTAWPVMLEAALTNSGGPRRYEILNLAVRGTGPDVYLRRFKALGVRAKPDVLLVGLYLGNDLANVRDPWATPSVWTDVYYWLKQHWYGGCYVKARLAPLLYGWAERRAGDVALPAGDASAMEGEQSSTVNPFLVEGGRQYPRYFVDTVLLSTVEMRRAKGAMLDVLSELADVAKDAGARVGVILIPPSVQVAEKYQAFYARLGYVMDPQLAQTRVIQEVIRKALEERGMAVLDALDGLQTRTNQWDYWANDDHLTVRGQQFLGETVARWVRSDGLVP